MTKKRNNNVTVTKTTSAAITGIFKGKVSNSNQFFLIVLIANLALIIIFSGFAIKNPAQFIPLVVTTIIAFFIIILLGFIRQCFVNPKDELYPMTTTFMGLNRTVEIKNIPSSFLTKDFLDSVASLRFFVNEPPIGLIQGDINDIHSIKILSEDERQQFKEKEKQEIIEHQKNIIKKLEGLDLKAQLQGLAATSPNQFSKARSES